MPPRRRKGRRSGRAPDQVAQEVEETGLDVNGEVSHFFVGVAGFEQHLLAQNTNRDRYAAGLAALHKNGVEILDNAKIRALAAAWVRNDYELATAFLSMRETFSLVEVLKALTLLDSRRQMRVLEKKLRTLELITGPNKPRPIKITRLKTSINNIAKNLPSQGSVSGALTKHIRKWVQQFTSAELEFFALHMPTEPWRKLADLCHFNPTKDFTNLPWFLSVCYGQAAPENSFVARGVEVNADNVNSVLSEVPLPFTHIRNLVNVLTDESKATIVRGEDSVDRGIWWYQELACPLVDQAISARLDAGEETRLNYGKLMERLLMLYKLRPNIPAFYQPLLMVAEAKLETTRLSLEVPIAVLADASSSMSVAIETATIISSLLTAFTTAKLVFFKTSPIVSTNNPRTTEDVIKMAATTRAGGSTAPAAALYPFYEKKEVIKTFIVVTDEEENTAYQSYRFTPLFKKYSEEVHPANLVFVSFLRSQTNEGQMVKELRSSGINPRQFRLSGQRPDLTKLDNMLGLMTSAHAEFNDQIIHIMGQIEENTVLEVFKELFGHEKIGES